MKPFLSAVWAVAWKDLALERRSRGLVAIMLLFAITSLVLYNFALFADLAAARELAAGLAWVTLLLAATLGLNRSLAAELENRALDGLLAAPVARSAIYLGKVLAMTVSSLLVEAVLIPLLVIFFSRPFWRPQIWLLLALGTLGYLAAGVLIASMAVQTRGRDVLLPVLLLPLSLPAVLAAAQATAMFLAPQLPAWETVRGSLALLVGYDILMLTVGLLTFAYVVEE
ncbi:MAG: heme exporter protein CcmB [Candidatus Promineifilaceae bacterium]